MHRSTARIATFLAAAAVSVLATGASQAAKLGKEFRVNTFTSKDQRGQHVAHIGDGKFVVVWYSDGQDGSRYGVYGQRYNSNGGKVGEEFQINQRTGNDQQSRGVAGCTCGSFVATWESLNQDGSLEGVYARRYRANGTPYGNEFRVNSTTANNQFDSAVAPLTNGGFVIVWESLDQDGSGYGIFGQRYAANGAAAGEEFQVNTWTDSDQLDVAAAGLADGGFVVTWTSVSQDGSGNGIYGQRYRANGARAGSEFRVNSETDGDQKLSSVAGLTAGGFVVTWQSAGQDGSETGIYGQRYNANGRAVGDEFKVNTTTVNAQEVPDIAELSDGGFVVTWHSFGKDGDGNGVYGQRYRANGTRAGGEFRINTHTADAQEFPSVAGLADGEFVAVWYSENQDGSGTGVYGQRFGP